MPAVYRRKHIKASEDDVSGLSLRTVARLRFWPE